MIESFILPAISLGLSAVSIPGPLQAYLISVTLRYGWRRALLVAIAPPIVDTPIVAVVVFLLGSLPDGVIQIIRLLGGLLLLWIALSAWKQYRSGASFGPAEEDNELDEPPRRTFFTALMLNAVSPGPYLFWSTVTGPLLLSALDESFLHGIAFLLAFYGTFLGGLILLAIAFDRLGRVNPGVTRAILLLTVVLLLYFGTTLIAQALLLSPALQAALVVALVLAGLLLVKAPRQAQA